MRPSGRLWTGALGALAFGAGVFAGITDRLPDVDLRLPPAPGEYQPSYRVREGQEVALVFIGSSGCTPSNDRRLPGWIDAAKLRLRARAEESGRSFTAVGVARDWDVDAGMGHLRRFGKFDEVTAGRNWWNSGVLQYVWEDLPGEAATPQVLVLERTVGAPEPDEQHTVSDSRILLRKVGVDEIRHWVENGMPLPALPPVAPATPAR